MDKYRQIGKYHVYFMNRENAQEQIKYDNLLTVLQIIGFDHLKMSNMSKNYIL